MVRQNSLCILFTLLIISVYFNSVHPQTQETPVPLSLPVDNNLYGQLQVSGFGVGGYQFIGNTQENSFLANKIAISAFEQINPGMYFFGQLTTALEEEGVDIEIDNLIFNFTPVNHPNLSIRFGKFDAPIGFERDDEPLNFQPSHSFNFEFARPVKYIGLFTSYTVRPSFDISFYLINGWNLEVDNNKAKTIGTRLGFWPGEKSNLGLSLVLGFPKEENDHRTRFLTNLDYTFQPRFNWLLAGELNYGREEEAALNGNTGQWFGGQLTSYYEFTPSWGLVVRYDIFRDNDGARTELPQTLQSFTIAPSFKLSQGQYGAYSMRENTTFQIPNFEIRLEFRLNHSGELFFEDNGESLSQWETVWQIQTVMVF